MTTVEQLLLELAPAPEPTLENFYPGGNAAVLGALRTAIEETNGVVYLWGSAGCGKSHLLRAAANEASNRGQRSQYLGADALAGDLPASGELIMLAIDDVERLDALAQSVLFDTFNRMRNRGGVIMAAGSRPPADLNLREDLRTRLGSGVVMQIRPLSEEEKREVLTARAAQIGLDLCAEIIDYLIARFARDLGSLVAAIDALDRYSLRTKRAITLPLLRETMRLQPVTPSAPDHHQ